MKKLILVSVMMASTLSLAGCVTEYNSEYGAGAYYTTGGTSALYPPPELTGYNSDYKPAKHLKKQSFYSKNDRRKQPGIRGKRDGAEYYSNETPKPNGGYHSSQSEADNSYYSNQKPKKEKMHPYYSSNSKRGGYYSQQTEDRGPGPDAPPPVGPNGSSDANGGYHS